MRNFLNTWRMNSDWGMQIKALTKGQSGSGDKPYCINVRAFCDL